MVSPSCERAIDTALRHGNSILKFISPNDAGVTGSHQAGFYLPKSAWRLYTPHAPTKGTNAKHEIEIVWPDGRITNSVVTWYGKGTRDEYRLTRLGRDFPWLGADSVGDLLVLIPTDECHFEAHVLEAEEDIQELQATLGVEAFEHWGVFQNGAPREETDAECLEREFLTFAEALAEFPTGEAFSAETLRVLRKCLRNFNALSPDRALVRLMESEYRLFRLAERQLCRADVVRPFRDVDDFLQTASRILNRRRSRAGRSLENHIDYLLTEAGIPHEMRPRIDGRPDMVIPSAEAYLDTTYPTDRLFVVGVKTTCKDRWRQVLNAGRRVTTKHILTTQPAISATQLKEVNDAHVTLVVPRSLHKDYPPERPMELLSVRAFIDQIRESLP